MFIKDMLLSRRKLAVYIHIPFCRRKCAYCYFFSRAGSTLSERDSYIRKVCDELRIYSEVFRRRRDSIAAVYIGGGSPSLLNKRQLRSLLSCIDEVIRPAEFPSVKQLTVEVNPEMFARRECEEKLAIMKSYSVNRLSFGVQAFNNAVLRKNGCIHRLSHIYNAVNKATLNGFSYNIDLMFGLPGSDFGSCIDTIFSAIGILPPHIQLNAPIHYVRGNRPSGRVLSPVAQGLLAMIARILLLKLRYGHSPYRYLTELSLKRDDLNVFSHLQWTGSSDVIGIGSSARSVYIKRNIIARNTADTRKYCMSDREFTFDKANFNYKRLLKQGVIEEFFKERLIKPPLPLRRCGKVIIRKKSAAYVLAVLKGIESEVNGLSDAAFFHYRQAMDIIPGNSLAYFCMADLFLLEGRPGPALEYISGFPLNNNSARMLSILFLLAKNAGEERCVRILAKKLKDDGVEINGLDIRHYHYAGLRPPIKRMRRLFKECRALARMCGMTLDFKDPLKREHEGLKLIKSL